MSRSAMRRMTVLALVAAGTVCQASCSQIAAEVFVGLGLSVVNAYIRQIISQAMGVGSGMGL